MSRWNRVVPIGLFLALALVVVGCSGADEDAASGVSGPASGPGPAAAAEAPPSAAPNDPFANVPGIVDASNRGWPREVEGLNGRVTIEAKPQRIITASVGHDEMTLGLVPISRLVGVGSSTKNPLYSNVADRVQGIATISRDPEVIVAQDPDIVVASPFLKPEVVEALTRVGVPVVQTGLENTPDSRIDNILLLGYIYGEEERALELASEVQRRYGAVTSVTLSKPMASRPRVIALTSYTDKLYTAGAGSTEGEIIVAAGGINVAAEAGIDGNATISMESVIAMNPDVIIIPLPLDIALEFKEVLLNTPAIAQVPAIRDGRVSAVPGTSYTTLSFWNLLGIEHLARILWPDEFGGAESAPFTHPE